MHRDVTLVDKKDTNPVRIHTISNRYYIQHLLNISSRKITDLWWTNSKKPTQVIMNQITNQHHLSQASRFMKLTYNSNLIFLQDQEFQHCLSFDNLNSSFLWKFANSSLWFQLYQALQEKLVNSINSPKMLGQFYRVKNNESPANHMFLILSRTVQRHCFE